MQPSIEVAFRPLPYLPVPLPERRPQRRLRSAGAQWPIAGRSGDVFDIFDHRDGRFTLLFADVCGNGHAVAPLARRVRRAVSLARSCSPGAILESTSRALHREAVGDRFVSAIVASIDTRSGTVQVASAGHLGPFLRPERGQARCVRVAPGPPIGIFPAQRYAEATSSLEAGDALVFASDGVTDRFATASDPLGESGLLRRLAGLPAHPRGICSALMDTPATSSYADAAVLAVQVV